MKKKGAVGLSLNFIVMLIIGIMVLGVGIALITGGLESVKTIWYKALGQAESELTEQPTLDEPSVISLGNPTTIKAGRKYNAEIAVLNPTDSDLLRCYPVIKTENDCNSKWLDVGEIEKTIERDGGITNWKGVFGVPAVTPANSYFCTFVAKCGGTFKDKTETTLVVNVE